VSFAKVSGTSTTLITSSPQTSSSGSVAFTARSVAGTPGTDSYRASTTIGSSTATSAPCTVTTQ
jgi:hypothetical protein